MNFAALSQVIMPPSNRMLNLSPNYESTNIKIYAVPYSEHSSFRELASFIASLDIQQIIPTVNISQKDKLFYFIDKWQQEKATKRIEVVAYPNENYW
ncbi:hypothetical protein RMCBS344292_16487 [Rhizopus microsporus]|nr:hypothetical protein RMCBS344292_16487 [Rhizopus microsporus]